MQIKDLVNLLHQYDPNLIVEVFNKNRAEAFTICSTDAEDEKGGYIYIVTE